MDRIRRIALVGLGLGLAVSACGSSDGSESSATASGASAAPVTSDTPDTAEPTDPSEATSSAPAEPTAPVPANAPACEDVWEAGAKLPRAYPGCVSDGEYIKRDVLDCSSGQRLVRFDDAYYGVLGGEIKAAATTPLVDDADYRDSVIACRG